MSTAELNFKLTRLLQAKGVLVGDICCSKSTVSEDGQVVEIWKDVDFLRQWESREMSQECLPDAFLELISTTATRERYPTNLSYPYLGEVKKKYVEHQSVEAPAHERLPDIRLPNLLR